MGAANNLNLRIGRVGKLDKIINNLRITTCTGLHRRKPLGNEYKRNSQPLKNRHKQAK